MIERAGRVQAQRAVKFRRMPANRASSALRRPGAVGPQSNCGLHDDYAAWRISCNR